ncbi:molybdenum ABC transporter ATP-binding protein, partial [Acinetobacter baumannii]|nr:molybdenum ABC transporter ATP-binding protein [Acinetobacter baumannii]
ALLYSPKLLLLDEPLSALDANHKAEIIPFFQKVKMKNYKIHIVSVSCLIS